MEFSIETDDPLTISFISTIDSGNVDIDLVNYLEVYIEAYASGSNAIKFESPKKCDYIIPLGELTAFKQKYGKDAIQPYEEYENHWVCVCGCICQKNASCPVCNRSSNGETDKVQIFLESLDLINDIPKIIDSFMPLQDMLPEDIFVNALSYIQEIERLAKCYGLDAKISESEKNRIKKLLIKSHNV